MKDGESFGEIALISNCKRFVINQLFKNSHHTCKRRYGICDDNKNELLEDFEVGA